MSYLTGEKVVLRPMTRDDLYICARWASDPEVTRYMYLGTFPPYMETLRREYDEMVLAGAGNLTQEGGFPTKMMFMVYKKNALETIIIEVVGCERIDCPPIGWVGLFGIDWINRVAEFRAIIGEKSCWGGGYAFDAYRLILGYGFDRLNLRKITGGQRADNYAAIKAARKVGFVEEGRLREHFLRNGQAHDIIVNGVLRDEFYALFPDMAPQPPKPPRPPRDAIQVGFGTGTIVGVITMSGGDSDEV